VHAAGSWAQVLLKGRQSMRYGKHIQYESTEDLMPCLQWRRHEKRCNSTCMNAMQTGIMPCATFRTVPFQYSSSHSFENFPIRCVLIAHSNAKCFSTDWQHGNTGAWLNRCIPAACKQCTQIAKCQGPVNEPWKPGPRHNSQSRKYLTSVTPGGQIFILSAEGTGAGANEYK
jgi:hypothetical protein